LIRCAFCYPSPDTTHRKVYKVYISKINMVNGNENVRDYERFITPTQFVNEDGGLVDLAYAPLNADSGWSAGTFARGYDQAKEITGADIATFSEIMLGNKDALAGLPSAQVEAARKGSVMVAQDGMTQYGVKYANALAEIAWMEGRGEGLFNMVFTMPTFKKGRGASFDPVVDAIEFYRAEQKAISDDPEAYFAGKAENLKPIEMAFFTPFKDRIVDEFGINAKNKAIRTVGEYGFPKFVADNIKLADAYGNDQAEGIMALNQEVRSKLEALGPEPAQEKVQELQQWMQNKRASIGEFSQNALEQVIPMVEGLNDLARTTIAEYEAAMAAQNNGN